MILWNEDGVMGEQGDVLYMFIEILFGRIIIGGFQSESFSCNWGRFYFYFGVLYLGKWLNKFSSNQVLKIDGVERQSKIYKFCLVILNIYGLIMLRERRLKFYKLFYYIFREELYGGNINFVILQYIGFFIVLRRGYDY